MANRVSSGYALDLWFEGKYRKQCGGDVHLVGFADDFVTCFQYGPEARRFHNQVRERLEKFGLQMAEEKTHRRQYSVLSVGASLGLDGQHSTGRRPVKAKRPGSALRATGLTWAL